MVIGNGVLDWANVWVKGKWKRKKRYHQWVPGNWKKVPEGYIWIEGYWKK